MYFRFHYQTKVIKYMPKLSTPLDGYMVSFKHWIQGNAFHSFTNDRRRVSSRNILFCNKYLSMDKVQYCEGLTV
jgi:hypothetical protein